jgi:UDP-3-O-[3-hydroxymyristoyl] N-acetylglucosamine deacetylase/3-hydroxyacyl-[acyl-carrier-protein] dehydratase
MKQRTIRHEASLRGKALHTGSDVTVTIKPAPEDSGIIFRRTDLYGKPEVRPTVDMVTELVRNTTVSSDHLKLHTIEHMLAAFSGLGVDNAIIELDGSEPPIMDGSARPFVHLRKPASSSRPRHASSMR